MEFFDFYTESKTCGIYVRGSLFLVAVFDYDHQHSSKSESFWLKWNLILYNIVKVSSQIFEWKAVAQLERKLFHLCLSAAPKEKPCYTLPTVKKLLEQKRKRETSSAPPTCASASATNNAGAAVPIPVSARLQKAFNAPLCLLHFSETK